MKLRSLHARMVLGTLVWSTGVIAAGMAATIASIRYHAAWARWAHDGMLAVVAAVLVVAGLSILRRGLSPFGLLQERLAAVRNGRSTRLEGEYPSEVEPLVHDLNMLIEDRERRVAQAVARAGDLAHGLKTPLAVLAHDIDRADAAGQHELATSLRREVERMRRQVEAHLAQARASASGAARPTRANVAQAVQGLVRTMERLFAERSLAFTVDAPADLDVRVPLEDLEEMVGNLLDNACKWARSCVRISATLDGDRVTIAVDDDGHGLEASMRERVLTRGVRADEQAPGSGLGLAIVRDLADAYGGTIALGESPIGGVRARLILP